MEQIIKASYLCKMKALLLSYVAKEYAFGAGLPAV